MWHNQVSADQTQPNNKMNSTELRDEIYNCTAAIQMFKIGCRHLAPGGLHEAPSIKWLEMQKRGCVRELAKIRSTQALQPA